MRYYMIGLSLVISTYSLSIYASGYESGSQYMALAASPRVGLSLACFRHLEPVRLSDEEPIPVNQRLLVDMRQIVEAEDRYEGESGKISSPRGEDLVFARVRSQSESVNGEGCFLDVGSDQEVWAPRKALFLYGTVSREDGLIVPGVFLDEVRGFSCRALREGEEVSVGSRVLVYELNPSVEDFEQLAQECSVVNLIVGKEPTAKKKRFLLFAQVTKIRYTEEGEPVYWLFVGNEEESGWALRKNVYGYQ